MSILVAHISKVENGFVVQIDEVDDGVEGGLKHRTLVFHSVKAATTRIRALFSDLKLVADSE